LPFGFGSFLLFEVVVLPGCKGHGVFCWQWIFFLCVLGGLPACQLLSLFWVTLVNESGSMVHSHGPVQELTHSYKIYEKM